MWVVVHIRQIDSNHTELHCVGDFPEQWEAKNMANSLQLLAPDDSFAVNMINDPLRYMAYLVKKVHSGN